LLIQEVYIVQVQFELLIGFSKEEFAENCIEEVEENLCVFVESK